MGDFAWLRFWRRKIGAKMQKTLASRANTLIGWKWLLFGRRKTFTEHNGKSCVSGWYSTYGLAWRHLDAFGSTPAILNLHHVISGNENVHVSAKDLSLDSDKLGNMVAVSYRPKSSEHGEQMSGGVYLLWGAKEGRWTEDTGMIALMTILAQTNLGFLSGGRGKWIKKLSEEECKMQLEKAAARATVVLTVNETNSILMHFKHEATRFPCLKGCCGLKRDACGPTSFLEYRHVALMWFLQVLTKAALVFDKILQSFNWQRKDSLLSTQSPCQDKPNLRDHKWPGHCRGNWCPQGLSVQNPRNVLSANHRTLDGCDAMATLLFSCKLQRSLLSVRSPAKSSTPDKPLALKAYKG